MPVPPRHGEVLERGPAHGRTQPAAHRAGGHGGVVRPVARPAGRIEGPDVVSPRHVPERDAGLDVADTEPRGGLPHPAEEEEVLPVRALEPDVLERKGRIPCALHSLVVREIDCGDSFARRYMPAHQHSELFQVYPAAGDLIVSAQN